MTKKIPDVRDVEVEEKKIVLRSDLDVPLADDLSIEDDTRLTCGLLTIQYLLDKKATVIIIGHLGRPQNKFPISNFQFPISDKNKKYSLKPVAQWYSKQLIHESGFTIQETKIGGFSGWQITQNLFLLENLRFFKEEEENDPEFSRKLALLGDLYVNDAFAVSHRAHASTVGVAKLLPHAAGIRLQEEISTLGNALDNPKRPLVVIIGGAKLETKLPLVSKMLEVADTVIVGGKIAGKKEKILQSLGGSKNTSKLVIGELNSDQTDITQKSLFDFISRIKNAQTIIWNGPVGYVEKEESAQSSEDLARAILSGSATSIVGGGDTLDFLKKRGFIEKFSFASTGGGAMLSFLSGETLPALRSLVE